MKLGGVRVFLFKLKDKPEICVEVDQLLPEKLKGLNLKEVSSLKVRLGRLEVDAEEVFDIEKSDGTVIFEGKWLERVKRIGFGMREGEILVKGNAGMYTGAFMKGGKIVVEGNTDRFAGMNMSDGEIIIRGNAGDYTGSGYRGDAGMKGGRILVEGNAGDEVGIKMKGGEIVVMGEAGLFFGGMMNGGIARAKRAIRTGANMKNGIIVLEQAREDEILPGFIYSGKDRFENRTYHIFEGDKAVRKSKGKLLIRNLE
jgi:formylmethanofuran dehydrogenase subunit C